MVHSGRRVDVLEVRNPDGLSDPRIGDLFERAFEDPDVVLPSAAYQFCERSLKQQDPHFGLLIVLDDEDQPCGLCLVTTRVDEFSPLPFILYFYAEGRTKYALGDGLVAWLHARGYDDARAINGTHMSDKAWSRIFGRASRCDIVKVGSLMELSVTGVSTRR